MCIYTCALTHIHIITYAHLPLKISPIVIYYYHFSKVIATHLLYFKFVYVLYICTHIRERHTTCLSPYITFTRQHMWTMQSRFSPHTAISAIVAHSTDYSILTLNFEFACKLSNFTFNFDHYDRKASQRLCAAAHFILLAAISPCPLQIQFFTIQ